jgi:hypothetical protein
MSAAAIVTLIIVALLVGALAFYLIWVVLIVNHVNDTLGKVTFGVRAIAHRTGPVGPALTDVNGNLTAVADALEDFASSVSADT